MKNAWRNNSFTRSEAHFWITSDPRETLLESCQFKWLRKKKHDGRSPYNINDDACLRVTRERNNK